MTKEPSITPKSIPQKTSQGKTSGKWFQKIPTEILFSPGGVILIFFAFIIEIIDMIPIPAIDQAWELPLEIVFIILLAIIAKTPFLSMIIPFIIERIPIVNDIVPTWLIRMIS